ncbi:hypothetical protein NQ317_010705 [Molorchus minor]|uniref:Cilia- and flagella-associated protein 36 n=1 Tax=Molorchus minor TaxID=1323400 RepID=A0ABQ9K668_9CUCU|nr:hypothetical protein NQ317_010705 [Molorchus minor]
MEDENSWVFDSLVCFLNGPIWNAPLQNFIEEKSLIFEPNVNEHKEYEKIFEEFKKCRNFMEDIGISPEQFEVACKEGKKYQLSFDQNLFEQIWAANDYEMFKRMMTQRNVELQLQALELIERKYGITPKSFIPKSKEENDKQIAITVEKSDMENNIMDEVEKNFATEEPSTSSLEVQNIVDQKQDLQKILQEAKALNEFNQVSQIDAVELKKRQEYLRAQRDKLVALKKEARKKQLNAETESKEDSKNRPRSAKAAKAVLTGEKTNIEPQQLQLRKTLAERLKSEVVNKELK